MLKVRLVVWSGSEQHNARIIAVRRCQADQRLAERVKEWRQALELALIKNVGECARKHQTVFQGIPSPCRALRAVSEHPPLSIRRPHEVSGIEEQIVVLRHPHVMTGSEETGVREDQFRG